MEKEIKEQRLWELYRFYLEQGAFDGTEALEKAKKDLAFFEEKWDKEKPEEKSELILEVAGHKAIDLGLNVKWADCNVGASSPSDYGDYFAWGEIKPKSEYTKENCKTWFKGIYNIAGDPNYDAARALWGSTWRLPTKEEIEELASKCKLEWTTQGGHRGHKITGPNGNSIFLPTAGWRNERELLETGAYGYCWSATSCEDNASNAYFLSFGSGYFGRRWAIRYIGQSVRPVTE